MTQATLWRASLVLSLIALALTAALVGAAWRRRHAPIRPAVMVAFFDVGDGGCALVRTADGRAALVGAGPARSGRLVVQALRRLGVKTLDVLVLPGPDAGEIGGAQALLASGIGISQVWSPPNGLPRETLEALRKRHVPTFAVHSGEALHWGSPATQLRAVWPPEHDRSGQQPVICRLEVGSASLLFAGGADASAENALVSREREALATDILQVAAHGDDRATSPEMLRRAQPSNAIISCGPVSPPGAGTLHRLQAAGAAIWRTDRQGAITVTMDGVGPPEVSASPPQ